ncbi:MAG: hypothetical protein NTV07_05780, partial [Candidatus Omnitrophica bacterium]|nr:hypothetical protein [Candidatus Omnitrophota bacterium]
MGFKKIKTIIEECKEFASWEKVLRLRPEAFWVFVTQVGIVVAGLIGVKMLTNLLGPSEYGRLSIANTMIALIGTSFFVPFSQGLLRFWSIAKERENLNVFYSAERKISHLLFFGALTVAVVLFLIAQYTSSLNGSLLVILALLTGTISGLISLKTGIFTANRRRAAVALLSIGTFLFRPLLAAALI